jgi:flagellar hook-length control protein FliK
MDIGQMMAVMQQMPANVAATPQVGDTAVPVEQMGGAFAGLLQGMSVQKAVPVKVAESGAQQSMTVSDCAALVTTEMMNDVTAALLATAVSNGKQVTAVLADSTDVQPEESPQQGRSNPVSQNVMPDLNAAQLAMLFGQLQGRMPEAGITTSGSRSEGSSEIPQIGQGVTESRSNVALPDIMPTISNSVVSGPQKPQATVNSTPVKETTVAPEVMRTLAAIPSVATQAPVMATNVSGRESIVLPTVANMIAETPQNEVKVTEGGKQAEIKQTEVPHADAIPLDSAERVDRQPAASKVPVRDAVQVVTVPKAQQEPTMIRIPGIVAERPADMANTVPLQPVADTHAVADFENRALLSEQPVAQSRVTTLSPAPIAAPQLRVPVQEIEQPEVPEQQHGSTAQQEQLQKVRSAIPTVSLSATAASAVDGKTETAPVRSDQRESLKTQQSQKVDVAQSIAGATSAEKQTSSEEQETPDRGMNGNFQPHVLHQTVKTESSLTASATSGATQSTTSRSDASPEQVVQQVRERFVAHETKPGSEQIVLRLSPEHLGELKVNLNLEGQRLKVEIVAENRVVRDSLMQHTEALKESLSRQNIKMESFEVTTGGNSSADSGRGQGSWRELAQQRQQNTWMPDGGYHLAKQVAPAVAAYQAKSEHTMVDLHY